MELKLEQSERCERAIALLIVLNGIEIITKQLDDGEYLLLIVLNGIEIYNDHLHERNFPNF